MKVIKFLKNLIIGTVIVLYLSFSIAMALLAINFNKYGNAVINGYTFIFVNEDLANEKYKEKDLIITKSVKKNNFEIGSEAFLYKIIEDELTGSKSVRIVIGKVGAVDLNKEGVLLENEEFYSREYVIGKTYKVVPGIGGILSLILNKTGFLITIIVPIFFIFTAQIYALIVEIKFGDDTIDKPKKGKKKETEEIDSEMASFYDDEPKKPLKSLDNDLEKEEIKLTKEKEKTQEKEEKVISDEKSINDLADDFLND